MLTITSPLTVLPPVYELPIMFWRWCKLAEVCAIVPELARVAEINFSPTPEELVSRFAALVRLNRLPDSVPEEKREKLKKKIFRYSTDGTGFWGKEVPIEGKAIPPYVPFDLGIGTPYPKGLFVPEGWAIDTLNAIRRGAVAAADWGDMRVGFPPRNSDRRMIHLDGKRVSYVAMMPDCV